MAHPLLLPLAPTLIAACREEEQDPWRSDTTSYAVIRCTIDSDRCRRVLAQILWEAASNPFDSDRFYFMLIDYSWTFVHPSYGLPDENYDPSAELGELLGLLDETRAASQRLMAAKVGETVELPLETQDVLRHIQSIDARIRDEPFAELAPDEQGDVLGCIEAARALGEQLVRGG